MKKNIFISVFLFLLSISLMSCGESQLPSEIPSQVIDQFEEVVYTWNSDYTSCTASIICINDESKSVYETVSATVENIDSTCEMAGSVTYKATFSNVLFEEQIYVLKKEALNHKYGEVVYTWNSDYSKCEAKTICEQDQKHIITEIVDSKVDVVDATPGLKGSKTYTATFTNSMFEVQTHKLDIPALGHTYGSISYKWNDDYTKCTATKPCLTDGSLTVTETVDTNKIVNAASCENTGLITHIATFSNDEFIEQKHETIIPALGHTEEKDNKVLPTCENTGLTEGKHCSVCEKVLIKQETIPALGHTEEKDNKVLPTCENTGLTEGKHCSVCEKVLIKQETIPALGHGYSNPTYVWNDEHTKCTATIICSNDSKHQIEEIANAVITNEDNKTLFTATFTNSYFEEQIYEEKIEETVYYDFYTSLGGVPAVCYTLYVDGKLEEETYYQFTAFQGILFLYFKFDYVYENDQLIKTIVHADSLKDVEEYIAEMKYEIDNDGNYYVNVPDAIYDETMDSYVGQVGYESKITLDENDNIIETYHNVFGESYKSKYNSLGRKTYVCTSEIVSINEFDETGHKNSSCYQEGYEDFVIPFNVVYDGNKMTTAKYENASVGVDYSLTVSYDDNKVELQLTTIDVYETYTQKIDTYVTLDSKENLVQSKQYYYADNVFSYMAKYLKDFNEANKLTEYVMCQYDNIDETTITEGFEYFVEYNDKQEYSKILEKYYSENALVGYAVGNCIYNELGQLIKVEYVNYDSNDNALNSIINNYKYDSAGRKTFEESIKYDVDNNIINCLSTERRYDDFGNQIYELIKRINNSTNNQSIDGWKKEYNEDNLMTYSMTFMIDEEGNEVKLSERIIRYDELGRIIYDYQESNMSELDDNCGYKYEYDEFDNVIYKLVFELDEEDNEVKDSEYYYEYDANKNQTYYLFISGNSSEGWRCEYVDNILSHQINFRLDDLGNEIKINESYYVLDEVYVTITTYNYENNVVIEKVIEKKVKLSNKLVYKCTEYYNNSILEHLESYTYDENGNTLINLIQQFDSSGNVIGEQKTTKEYNGNVVICNINEQIYIENDVRYKVYTETKYNEYEDEILFIGIRYEEETVINYTKTAHEYEYDSQKNPTYKKTINYDSENNIIDSRTERYEYQYNSKNAIIYKATSYYDSNDEFIRKSVEETYLENSIKYKAYLEYNSNMNLISKRVVCLKNNLEVYSCNYTETFNGKFDKNETIKEIDDNYSIIKETYVRLVYNSDGSYYINTRIYDWTTNEETNTTMNYDSNGNLIN